MDLKEGGFLFDPVNNCMNSVTTGLILSSNMTNVGENVLAVTEINLQSMSNQRLSRNILLPRTTLIGDRRFNDASFFPILRTSVLG